MIWKYRLEKETTSKTIGGNYIDSPKEIIPIPQVDVHNLRIQARI